MSDSTASPEPVTPRPRRRNWIPFSIVLLIGISLAVYRYMVTRPEYRFAIAKQSIASRDWESAEWLAARLEGAGREDLSILLRAEVRIQRADPNGALELLNRFPTEGERRADAAAMVGRCLMGLNRPQQAFSAFRLALELEPNHIEARRGAAQIAYNIGQLETAIGHLQALIELDPRDGKPRKLLGDIQADLGRHALAVDAYRAARDCELVSNLREEVTLSLATSLAKLNRFEEMLAIAQDPGTSPEWAVLHVKARRGLGHGAEARVVAEAALTKFTGSHELLAMLGQLELDEGHTQAAVKVLKQAYALAPRDYPVCLLLSQAFAADGNKAEADRLGKQAEDLRADLELITKLTGEAEQKPWDATVRRRLAEVCERMGNTAMAKQWRELASQLER